MQRAPLEDGNICKRLFDHQRGEMPGNAAAGQADAKKARQYSAHTGATHHRMRGTKV